MSAELGFPEDQLEKSWKTIQPNIMQNTDTVKLDFNTSYLTDSYISFTLKLESGQNSCSNRSIRSSTYGKKNISDFPPCGKLVIFVTEFVIFLKTSK